MFRSIPEVHQMVKHFTEDPALSPQDTRLFLSSRGQRSSLSLQTPPLLLQLPVCKTVPLPYNVGNLALYP